MPKTLTVFSIETQKKLGNLVKKGEYTHVICNESFLAVIRQDSQI